MQPTPDGLAQAFIIGREFVGDDPCALVLGDNIFYGHDLADAAAARGAQRTTARPCSPIPCTIPSATASSSSTRAAARIEPRGEAGAAEVALRGDRPLFLRQPACCDIAATLKPSPRGELEITDVNARYLERGRARSRGAWAAASPGSTPARTSRCSRRRSSSRRIEHRQGLKIACPEEIAYRLGYIDAAQLERLAEPLAKNGYGQYLLGLLREPTVRYVRR